MGWTREKMLTRRIGVLLGGQSSEREISLKTGNAVIQALIERGYEVTAIDVASDLPQQLREAEVDIAFVALHGRFGEDGRVQGLLEMLQIPYTGSGVMTSSVAINKVVTKQLLLYHGLPTPGFDFIRPGDAAGDLCQRCVRLPLVVKPSREGSTIGISIARDAEGLRQGVAAAAELDGTVLVEDFIDGVELTVSVINNRALPVIQIVPKSGFYDYQAKYLSGDTQYLLPAPVDAEIYKQVQKTAEAACRALGCRGAARVDFMYADDGYFCIEINTIPGMTETSLLPKAAAAAGIAFPDLVEMILLDADLDK
jgi:D-alanine-D-alanine ligase